MKVKKLIKLLLDMDQNAEVILQKDSEGNGYSPLYGVDHEAVYLLGKMKYIPLSGQQKKLAWKQGNGKH